MNKQEKFSRVADGFSNMLSRTGTGSEVDNQLSNSNYTFNLLSRNRMQLEAMYRGSWAVGVVVDAIAEDMTRAGIKITSNEGAEDIEDLHTGMSNLRLMNSLQDVIKWARLYGGGIGVMMVDGQDMSTPLLINRIQKGQFSGVAAYDRWQVTPDLTNVIRSGPDMGLPAYYNIITSENLVNAGLNKDAEGLIGEIDYSKIAQSGGIRVHHSRVVRQVGVKLPYFQAITEQQWGMSVIERLFDRLVSFDNATMSSANLINMANLRTVSVDGLREAISSGGKAVEGLMAFFDMMRMMQSNEGLTLLDKEDAFASQSYSFAGLSDMMLQFGQQLSGAAGIPLVRFFGQSPAGMSATGESDFRMYYDNVNSLQEANLRPSVDKLIKVAHQSLFGRPAPKDMQFKFVSLWQTTATEKATNAKTVTETVTGAYDSGLVSKSTALKELRQASAESGLFTNISDEDIATAEKDDEEDLLPELELEEPATKPEPVVKAVADSKPIPKRSSIIEKLLSGVKK